MTHSKHISKTESPTPLSNWYVIRVRGHFDGTLSNWFGDLSVSNLDNEEAELTGFFPDQAALFGALMRLRDLGIPLISINPADRISRRLRRS